MLTHDVDPNALSNSLPGRLNRLNEELTSGTKRCDQVNAVHDRCTVRVLVERVEKVVRRWSRPDEYKASCRFDGRELWAYGVLPSHAFQQLTERLSWAIAKYDFEHEMRDTPFMQTRDRQRESDSTAEAVQ